MRMHRSVCGMLWLSAALCFILKMMLGSYVDADGFLREPFFLLPVGYGLLVLALVTTIILAVQRWHRRAHRN
ncbi:DUF3955 domain-containing protein [Lactiplantibacillus garii]|uniref:DUF3955 domain-containing protein n=1 Tax=Lactiplantibacillus garii TaxID=2306423 RepID=A0A426D9N5_9LACO|nr:DUF3955 domain-containing protein [Lactiplantibacillus garii]RRK11266.1 DUF3955 domain-containing protein [Lactiplantibacillus garii]